MRILPTTLFAVLLAMGPVHAQDVTTVEATSADISDNLDLHAVARAFGEAKNLEDFERMLNDPEAHLSNLDLNNDGYVDYLRVIEKADQDVHVVTIQAMLGDDLYQDVATIDVQKDATGETRVQVVGDVYMYGPDYYIEPIYVRRPVIFLWFWSPLYAPWYSPFYWGYYPPYFTYWAPYPTYTYITYVTSWGPPNCSITYVHHRTCMSCPTLQTSTARNDLARKKPEQAFAVRNPVATNKQDLERLRNEGKAPKPGPASTVKNTGREVQKDWKPTSTTTGDPAKPSEGKVTAPAREEQPAKPKDRVKPEKPTKEKPVKEKPVKKEKTVKPPKAPKPAKPEPSRKKVDAPSPAPTKKGRD